MARGDSDDSIMRRGARLLWLSVRTQPRPFALAVTGATLFAVMAVGGTIVLGKVTDDVLTPAVEEGGVERHAVLVGALALVIASMLRMVGVVLRRYFGQMAQRRMQMLWFQRVTERYLAVPLQWFDKHPPGELLAHADADCERSTMAMQPLPFSLGVVVIIVVSMVQLAFVDPVLLAMAFALFPGLAVLNNAYTKKVERRPRRPRPGSATCRPWPARASRAPSSSRPSASRSARSTASGSGRRTCDASDWWSAGCGPASSPVWTRCPASVRSSCCGSARGGSPPGRSPLESSCRPWPSSGSSPSRSASWASSSRSSPGPAFAALGLTGWLDELPDGLQAPVGERGNNLSVGERQLVALARAQLGDPGLLILDEATSSVDPETEQALTEALERLSAGRTVVSIAHRLSTAERADLVVVVDEGEVVEQGTHAELVDAGGVYAGLYASWLGNTRVMDPDDE